MKIVYFGYRDWSIDIFGKIDIEKKYLVTNKDYSVIEFLNPDLVFFIGWSDIVPIDIIKKYTCICLHPSPLPKYRGGSPIQHQIINNEKHSAVTFFIMDQGIDTGDILYQPYLSLGGTLSEILQNIKLLGIEYLNKIIIDYKKNQLIRYKQDNSKSTYYKRRKESDSEITIEEIENSTPQNLHNKIRSLNNPYPNAFIKCKDGKKLFITESNYEE